MVYAKPAGCRLRLGMCDKCEGPAYYRWDYPDCANNVPIDARRTKNPVFVAFAERSSLSDAATTQQSVLRL